MVPAKARVAEAVPEMREPILGQEADAVVRAAWWWIDRWRQSAAYTDMTAEEQGLYRNLLDEVWLREDHIVPDDERILGRVSGDHEAWKRCGKKVLRWMKKVPGGWTQTTALEVIGQSTRRAANQKRYRENRNNTADNATDNGGDNKPDSPSPSPSKDQDQNNRPSASPGAIATRAASWTSEACDDWTTGTGGTAPGGRIGKALKPLLARVASEKGITLEEAWSKVRPFWQRFCGSDDVKFGPQAFADNPRRVLPKGNAAAQARATATEAGIKGGWIE